VKLLLWALAKVIGTSCYGDARLTTNIATHSFEVELSFWLGLTARNSSAACRSGATRREEIKTGNGTWGLEKLKPCPKSERHRYDKASQKPYRVLFYDQSLPGNVLFPVCRSILSVECCP
jgi:hypothetical protein